MEFVNVGSEGYQVKVQTGWRMNTPGSLNSKRRPRYRGSNFLAPHHLPRNENNCCRLGTNTLIPDVGQLHAPAVLPPVAVARGRHWHNE
jgi:hypothetical protein